MRSKLNKAFRELRKQKLIALQSFACCSNCGHSILRQDLTDSVPTDSLQSVGYAFYHIQDAEDRDQNRPFYVSFGCNPASSDCPSPHSTKAVGDIICETFNKAGVKTEWNGNPDTRIKITSWK